jgi:hypothetical protein
MAHDWLRDFNKMISLDLPIENNSVNAAPQPSLESNVVTHVSLCIMQHVFNFNPISVCNHDKIFNLDSLVGR